MYRYVPITLGVVGVTSNFTSGCGSRPGW